MNGLLPPVLCQGPALVFLLSKLLADDAVEGRAMPGSLGAALYPSKLSRTLLCPWHHFVIPTFSAALKLFLRFLLT